MLFLTSSFTVNLVVFYFNFTLPISLLNNAGDFLLRRTNEEFFRGQYLTDTESLLTKGIFSPE